MPRKDIVAPKGKAKYEEIVKCGSDPLYFLKRYGYISHPKKGLIKFDTYPFQDDCVRDFETHRFNIVLKSRQLGLSTVCAGYCLWMALFQKGKNIMVLATRLDVAKNFLRKVLVMYDNLPDWLVLPREKSRSVKSIEFTNESRITAVPTGDDAGRSEGLSLLIVDEAAHIQGFDELWMGLYSTVSTGGNIILLSCVSKDTYVYTDKGPKQISYFIPPGNVPGDYVFTEPYTVQGHGKARSGTLWHNQGKVKTATLVTCYGKIEGSMVHKVWGCKNGNYGWYELQDFGVVDWIAHYGGQELWGSNNQLGLAPYNPRRFNTLHCRDSITQDLAYLFGLYLVKGSPKRINGKLNGIKIICDENFTDVFDALELRFYTNDLCHYQVVSADLVEAMRLVGIDLEAHVSDKKISSRLLEMNRENIIALLQGIFDAVGTPHKTAGVITLTCSSLELVNQVRMLLSNFGIWTTYEQISKEKFNREILIHKLKISGESAKKFSEKIGFRLPKKQEKIAEFKSMKMRKSANDDIIPFSVDLAKELLEQIKNKPDIDTYRLKKVTKSVRHNFWANPHLRREVVAEVVDLAYPYLSTEQKIRLEGIIHPNICWAQVENFFEGEAEVYDFSLPNNKEDFWAHSVVYGNILGHQTPKGVGNVFHRTWMGCDMEKGENDFHGIKLPWTVHPEHDQEWYEEQCRNLDARGIQQELNCSFLGSGHTYLHESSLEYLYNSIQPPIERLGNDGGVWIWKYPETGHNYIISADVARGDSEDYSTAHVIDTTADEVVGEYQGKIPPDRYAELLADLGNKYFKALICPENNSFGLATAYKLRDLKYPNLYYEKFAKNGIYQHYSQEEVKDLIPGISTTVKNRQQILAKLEEVIRNKKIRIYSARFAEEAKTFIWNSNASGGKAQAMKGYNDDLIMSLAIGCFLYDAEDRKIDNDELNRAMLAAWGKSVTKLTNNNYSDPQPESAGLMAFQKVNHGSIYVHQKGVKPYFEKPPTQQNMRPGVALEQARKTIDVYNNYSWLFSDDDKPKKE